MPDNVISYRRFTAKRVARCRERLVDCSIPALMLRMANVTPIRPEPNSRPTGDGPDNGPEAA